LNFYWFREHIIIKNSFGINTEAMLNEELFQATRVEGVCQADGVPDWGMIQ
jgi:hypothetical protein